MKDFSVSCVYNKRVIENPLDTTDEELVRLSLADAQCFAILIDRYQEKLTRYIRRRARVTNEDVDDLLQDIFIKAYTHLQDFDTKLSFSSWIYRITHNHVISWCRKHNVRNKDRMGDIDEELLMNIAQEYNIEHEQWMGDMKNIFQDILQKLPDRYRVIVELRFFEGKDYAEMSDILQIPPGTVATNLNRAKKKIQKLLADYI